MSVGVTLSNVSNEKCVLAVKIKSLAAKSCFKGWFLICCNSMGCAGFVFF